MSESISSQKNRVVEAELRSDNIVAAAPQVAGLPMALILGDSISIGYTPVVRARLEGLANVVRPKINCQHTGVGLQMLDEWTGEIKWDVIHFNFGIWDTHLLDDQGELLLGYDKDGAGSAGGAIRHTPEQYGDNLEKIVERLKARCRHLLWASTTPVMYRKGERFEAIPTLNRVAAEIMRRHNIPTTDLYNHALPNASEWLSADQCHFNETGNKHLGALVTAGITKALGLKHGPGCG